MKNQELMNVLIGVRDFIKLDNNKQIRRDDEYMVVGTNFDSSDFPGPSVHVDKYPELNKILNEADHLQVVEAAIEQLKLIDLLES